MTLAEKLKEHICGGYQITKNDCMALKNEPLNDLCEQANEIRKHFLNDIFDICTIVNGKSGRCSEDCKFCAQSSYYETTINEFPLRDSGEILKEANKNFTLGANRFSIVTSGRSLNTNELSVVCEYYEQIKNSCKVKLCASHGLLDFKQFVKLRKSGVTRYHNNIETSRRYFPHICTTHTFDDKIRTIKQAQETGFEV
jgi:biotin synthase